MDKNARRTRRKKGIRKKIYGTAEKPRITVFRSNRHLYVQAIDDAGGRTLSSGSDISDHAGQSDPEGGENTGVKQNTGRKGSNPTRETALVLGERLAKDLKARKIERAVFDRNGYLYHGVVRSLAEGIRKGGIQV